MNIERVKELLDRPVVCEDGKSHYIQENHKRYLSSLIYQLFESTPELAKEVGYVKLEKGDKVICKTVWDLLSPLIDEAIEEHKLKAGWRE